MHHMAAIVVKLTYCTYLHISKLSLLVVFADTRCSPPRTDAAPPRCPDDAPSRCSTRRDAAAPPRCSNRLCDSCPCCS